MIASLTGTLTVRDANRIIVETGGVGAGAPAVGLERVAVVTRRQVKVASSIEVEIAAVQDDEIGAAPLLAVGHLAA